MDHSNHLSAQHQRNIGQQAQKIDAKERARNNCPVWHLGFVS